MSERSELRRLQKLVLRAHLTAFPKDTYTDAETTMDLLLADLLTIRCELTLLRLETSDRIGTMGGYKV